MPAGLQAEKWGTAAKSMPVLALPALWTARASYTDSADGWQCHADGAGSRMLTLGVIKSHDLGRVNAPASVGTKPVVHHSLMVCL